MKTASELSLTEGTLEDLFSSKPPNPCCLVRINIEGGTEQILLYCHGEEALLKAHFEASIRQIIIKEKAEFLPERDIPELRQAVPGIFNKVGRNLVIFSKPKGSAGQLSFVGEQGIITPLGEGEDFFQAVNISAQHYILRKSWIIFKRSNH